MPAAATASPTGVTGNMSIVGRSALVSRAW